MLSAKFVALAAAVAHVVHAAPPLYKDPKAPIEARVEDLLKRMTLEEKVAQMYVVVCTATDL